ncbi:TfoX/Sxy family protein [Rhodobacter sp. NTK016B]|uniref:TfoX/Sxy family protein n=1 Tax=Rhodobacter sp. NTK016B TaxID=2759676 RepID=UPI001A8F3300|nr:TfoX/Sxy family protein [Rhodobacter sp. NTK016B]MBN8292644.1 TfoX/Sxy family protein [Rhodobacter sp. NTK016B]
MAYDETHAARLRADLADLPGVTEQPMFGGLFFLQNGNMLAGASGRGGGMVRVGPDAMSAALRIDGASQVEMGRRRMKGFVSLDDAAMADDNRRRQLVSMARAFVATLPPKA